ncbi:MAG: GspH/FimT family pseudopilin [Caldimonas sp.]
MRCENFFPGGDASPAPRRSTGWRAAGFSLVELLTTMSVLAILLAIASPGLASLVSANALSAVQGQLAASLMLARGEAMKRGATVGLAAIAPVSGAEFSAGWLIFVDANGNGQYDAGETIVRQEDGPHGDVRIASSGGATAVTFNGRGFLTPSTLVTLTACAAAASKSYVIRVEPVGLADVVEAAACT